VSWRAGGSALFLKRGLDLSCRSSTASDHLAGRGGEEVVRSVTWTARAGACSLWEPLEFRLSTAFLPRRRGLATVTRGHRSDHAVLGAQGCASSFLFVRSLCQASPATKPPDRPSGFVPGRYWGGAGEAWRAISGDLGPDCLYAIFIRLEVVKGRGLVVIFFL
jgi:hypothetical protein